MTTRDKVADRYAARVDAVLTQRTRLRGRQPLGDLFAGLPSDHPLVKADPRRPPDLNLEIIASYIQPDDVIIDVGGGAGQISLPLALHCREVINVEPSIAMGAGFRANAAQAGISNARLVEGDWLTVDPPAGTAALVNHVSYLTRESYRLSSGWSVPAVGGLSSPSIVHPRHHGSGFFFVLCMASRRRSCPDTWNWRGPLETRHPAGYPHPTAPRRKTHRAGSSGHWSPTSNAGCVLYWKHGSTNSS